LNKYLKFGGYFDPEPKKLLISELEQKMNAPDFWLDQTNAKKVSKQLSQLRDELDHIRKMENIKGELETYLSLLEEDFNIDLLNEAVSELPRIQNFIEKAEIECYLNDKYDHNDALLTIHSGAGGTES